MEQWKQKTVYNKQNKSARDVYVINKHLADAREVFFSKADETMDEDNAKLNVDEKYHPEIRKMLRKQNNLWSGLLGNLNITQHLIYLIPEAWPFNSTPYVPDPKSRELEQLKIDKRLTAGVIENSVSEWAAPALFTPKKDALLRFCVEYSNLTTMTIKTSYPLPLMD